MILVNQSKYMISKSYFRNDFESLQEYNQVARELPETTEVFVQRQDRAPEGYDSDRFGPWPGPSLLLQMEIASSHKSPSVRCVT